MTKARSNATANAAKGDLTVGTGTNLSGVLGVGNNGETLTADSSTATGLRYTAGYPISNPVINSAFNVWQRGTSLANIGTVTYSADRWAGYFASGGMTISRQATADTTNLPFIQYCARVQRDSGSTNTSYMAFSQSFESVNSIPFAGKTVNLSFYARKGANYNPNNLLVFRVNTGTGTDQNIINGFTGVQTPIAGTVTLSNTWQRFSAQVSITSGSLTAALGSTATQVAVGFEYTPTGTAGAADYYEVTGVQLDIGAVALPFRTNGATIEGELAACQRYYYLHASGNTQPIGLSANYSTTLSISWLSLPVTMRIAPTIAATTGTNYYGMDIAGTGPASNTLTIGQASTTSVRVDGTYSGLTVGQAGYLRTNNASASLAFTSEL